MRAMVLERPGQPLKLRDITEPTPGPGEVLIKVSACAVCRTDLHILDHELTEPKLPLVPGHEVIGTVVATGEGCHLLRRGQRVGVPWLGWTCGVCDHCLTGHENLCDEARFTGYTLDGGYAELAVASEQYCFPIPRMYSDAEAAPLLCAGLIGFRCLRKLGQARRVGIYGFGAAAHIVTQIARYEGREVFAFTRPGDTKAQAFAKSMGAVWAGESGSQPPMPMDAAIIFAPAGELVHSALRVIQKGGIVVCGGIHMSDIPALPYEMLWGERSVCSVANLTRSDGQEFFSIAPRVPVKARTTVFELEQANQALDRLRSGQLEGAAVLVP